MQRVRSGFLFREFGGMRVHTQNLKVVLAWSKITSLLVVVLGPGPVLLFPVSLLSLIAHPCSLRVTDARLLGRTRSQTHMMRQGLHVPVTPAPKVVEAYRMPPLTSSPPSQHHMLHKSTMLEGVPAPTHTRPGPAHTANR